MDRDLVPIGKPWPLRFLFGSRSFRRSGRLDKDSEVYPLAIHHCPCQTKNERPNLLAYLLLLNSEKLAEIIFVYVFVCSFYFPRVHLGSTLSKAEGAGHRRDPYNAHEVNEQGV